MLSEIIEHALASESDMVIVEGPLIKADDLGSFSRTKRIDVIIFPAGAEDFGEERITSLLHANPRLGILAMDGTADRGDLYHLVPTRKGIGRLGRSSVIAAIRAAAELRRR
jgi:hypothetical protein